MIAAVLNDALQARRVSGKGVLTQWRELLSLRFGGSRIGRSEYYFYRLFDRGHDAATRSRFAGWRLCRELDRALNLQSWRAAANDKLLMYAAFEGLGLISPRVVAVHAKPARSFGRAQSLTSGDEVKKFLRDTSNYPFFVKPVHGSYGRGAFSAMGYDQASDKVLWGSGDAWSVDHISEMVRDPRARGYLFQELVKTHPAIAKVCGPSPASVRVVVLLSEQGPTIVRCIWKIPTGRNMSDNFMHGETGNLLSSVDPDTGRVQRVISGIGFGLREVEFHPDTGQRVAGLTLPDWATLRALCLSGASSFPGLKLQHWDIALAEQGPTILEVNVEGSMDLPQLASGSGILDAEFTASLPKTFSRRLS